MTKRMYADASALVKLARREAESEALRDELVREGGRLVTSVLGRVEFERAIRKSAAGEDVDGVVEGVLAGVDLIPLNVAIAGLASSVQPPELRSLDAIHLATMMSTADAVSHVYCYDEKLAAAARERGLEVRAPGAR